MRKIYGFECKRMALLSALGFSLLSSSTLDAQPRPTPGTDQRPRTSSSERRHGGAPRTSRPVPGDATETPAVPDDVVNWLESGWRDEVWRHIQAAEEKKGLTASPIHGRVLKHLQSLERSAD